MNKFRTHNCSELNKSTIDKKVVLFGMATSKKRSWKFTLYRFKRSLWNNSMRNRK